MKRTDRGIGGHRFHRRRLASAGPGQVSEQAGQDRRALRARRRHRHHFAAVRRATARTSSASSSWSRTSPAPSAFSLSRKWRARGRMATRCSSATSRPTPSHPCCTRRSSRSTSRRDVQSVTRLAIYPSFLIYHHGEFRHEIRRGRHRSRQEEPGEGALHQRGHRQLPAFRHGDFRQARRRRHEPYPEQVRGRRHDQRSRRGRRADRVPQCGELGGDDQGRQAAPGRRARRSSGSRIIRMFRRWPRPAFPVSAPCIGRACSRRPRRRRRCWRRCTRRFSKRPQVPQLQQAFAKQFVSIKPNESVDDAQAWLKGELASWRKITSEVKIELTD